MSDIIQILRKNHQKKGVGLIIKNKENTAVIPFVENDG